MYNQETKYSGNNVMKRNDIVFPKANRVFYGRVVKTFKDYVLVIDTGQYIVKYRRDQLDVVNYKGSYDRVKKRFDRMPTLRKLKQRASHYNSTVWNKNPEVTLDMTEVYS